MATPAEGQQQNTIELPMCGYCEEPLLLTEPRSELPCHHFYHTQCMIIAYDLSLTHRRRINMQCKQCQVAVVEEETIQAIHQEEHAQHNAFFDEIAKQYDENPEFRRDVKEYRKACRGKAKPHVALGKLMRAKQKECEAQVNLLKGQLQALYELKLEELQNSQENKNMRKASRLVQKMRNRIHQKYNLNPWDLRHALRGKPGLRTWSRNSMYGGLDTQLKYKFRRFFRISSW